MSFNKKWLRKLGRNLDRAMTQELRGNFRAVSSSDLEQLRRYFLQRFTESGRYRDPKRNQAINDYWYTDSGQQALAEHVSGRLDHDRHEYVPWLNAAKKLKGAKFLEIGCGTGSSAVALAEQGAHLTGIDVEDIAIDMAQERSRLYGLDNTTFQKLNAVEIDSAFAGQTFDFIIFFASLEHMTYDERLLSLKAAWSLLGSGCLLCIIESPNRLWYFDDHTSNLPFYHWLPDELALEFFKRSPNYYFDPVFERFDKTSHVELIRRGRGVSFHEFELALGNIDQLKIVSDLTTFQISQNPLRWLYYQLPFKRRYTTLLRKIAPELPVGFCRSYLNVIFRK